MNKNKFIVRLKELKIGELLLTLLSALRPLLIQSNRDGTHWLVVCKVAHISQGFNTYTCARIIDHI